MKALIKIFILSIVFNTITWITPQSASAQVSVTFQVFYDELSPYGTWVENPEYGFVWVPTVAYGFAPYATNGYWAFTEYGWTWVSNYSWGWAPFHYGRWFFDPLYGPIWVPGNEWGPGWVIWRSSGDYYGWTPIGPGVNINIAYGDGYYVPNNQWTFVSGGNFGRTNINNYYVNSSNNVTIINNSTVINHVRVNKTSNVSYNSGPERADVEKRVGKKIEPIAIQESSKPSQSLNKNHLQIYKPEIQKNILSGSKPAPSKVGSLKNAKPAVQRTAETPSQKSNQPAKQQPSPLQQKPQQNVSPNQQNNQTPKGKREKQPQPAKPSQNMGYEKQQQQIEQPVQQKNSQPKQNNQPPVQQPVQPQQVNPFPVREEEKPQQHIEQPSNPNLKQPNNVLPQQQQQQQQQQRPQQQQQQQQGNSPQNMQGEKHPH